MEGWGPRLRAGLAGRVGGAWGVRLSRGLPIGVLALGLGGSALLAHEIAANARQRAQTEFVTATDRARTLIELQAGRIEQVMRGARAFLTAVPELGAADFRGYVETLDLRAAYPGVRALAFAPRVPADRAAALEQRLNLEPARKALGYPAFRVWPASDQPVRYPAVLVEPRDGNDRVFGYDLWSDPGRRAAARSALASGGLHASAPVELAPDGGPGRVSQLLVIPVYRTGGPPGPQPRADPVPLGFVAMRVTPGDMIAAAPGQELFGKLRIGVYDAGAVQAHMPPPDLARAVRLFADGTDAADAAAGASGGQRYDRVTEAAFAGRRWLIGFGGLAGFVPGDAWLLVSGTLAAGGLIAALLALLVHRLQGEQRRLRREVESRARALQQANVELCRNAEEARSANHAKSQFLASVSHELRTPLNAILGFSELLRMQAFGSLGSERNRAYVNDIHASGQRLLRQVDQILDLSKIEAGSIELRDDRVDLADAVAAVGHLFDPAGGGAAPDAVAPGAAPVQVDWAAPQDLPCLRGDVGAVDQILANLVGNAVKFSPPGGSVTVQAQLAADGRLRLLVADRGPGIPARHLAKVVEPFYQVADQHSRSTAGSGLGLAIVDRLVGAHGGDLTIDSIEGLGTRVTVAFPASRTLHDGHAAPTPVPAPAPDPAAASGVSAVA